MGKSSSEGFSWAKVSGKIAKIEDHVNESLSIIKKLEKMGFYPANLLLAKGKLEEAKRWLDELA